MPSPEARAAFNEAQAIAADMRDVHAQEQNVITLLVHPADAITADGLTKELARLRTEWANLMAGYTDAIGRFTTAVEDARRGR